MDALMDLDEDCLTAVLTLYREDLAQAKEHQPTSNNDNLIAIEIYLDQIESQHTFEKDRRLAESITHAKLNDLYAIDAIVRAEKQDAEDRELARRLAGNNGGRNVTNNAMSRPPPPSYDEAIGQSTPTLSKLAGLWVSEDAGKALHPDHLQGDVDMGIASQIECAACGDGKSYFEVMDAPCGHTYCKDCTREHFEMSFHDETMFPPRCCTQPIKIKSVAIFLTRDLIERFDEKDIEFRTTNKTYCANTECLKFILPGTISNNVGHCQKCNTDTCVFCKNKAHIGNDCPSDPNLQAVLNMAQGEGWQRCSRCKAMVELRIGCYHITCRWWVNLYCCLCVQR